MEEKKGPSLEERILESAKDLFFQRGFFETKTRNIANNAGTSESGLFRIFDNKYNILMAVYNSCWRKINDAIESEDSIKGEFDARQQIIKIVTLLWEFYEKDPLTVAFIIMNTGNTDTLIVEKKSSAFITDENVKYIQRIEDLCEQCNSQSPLTDGLTARALCEGILGISEGVLLGWYLADKTENSYLNKISLKEGVVLLKLILYGKIKT